MRLSPTLLALCVLSFSATSLDAAREKYPNILLIFADDIGYEALNCYGGLDFKTPFFMGDNGTQESYFKNPRQGQPNEKAHTRHTLAGRVNGGKNELCDAGAHVPLIVWGPASVPAGDVCDDLVDVVDLFPTFCALAGTAIPASLTIDGRSIAPQIHGRPGLRRNWTHQGLGKDESLFDGAWRLFRNSGQLWDARALPAEPLVGRENDSPEAKAARHRLGKLFETITRSGPRPPVPFGVSEKQVSQ